MKSFILENDQELAGEDEEGVDRMMHSAEGQFFFRVWLPCWLLYQSYPPLLMRRARRGDLDALDDLLRLDKSAICDPVLRRVWHEEVNSGNMGRRKRLLAAMAGRPKGRLTAKKMRANMGGLISQFASAFGCEVTEPEIKALFDRIAQARQGTHDVNLPLSPEARYKAIRRHRNWPSIFVADK